jgi:uncharacterized RDD family membrane protein YckC
VSVHVTGRRVIATWIDLFLVGVVYRILSAPLDLPWDLDGRDGDFASRVGHSFPALMLYAALAGLYYIAFEGIAGRTVGKWVTGIRVITDSGGRAGFGRVLLRTVFRLLDGIGGYVLGFLIVVLSSRRQRLGDMVAGTLVVRA